VEVDEIAALDMFFLQFPAVLPHSKFILNFRQTSAVDLVDPDPDWIPDSMGSLNPDPGGQK
jgi:hypothetical protein